MQKIRQFIHSRYLDRPMNIALVMSCFTIIFVQLYFIFKNWLEKHIDSIISFINSNDILLAVVAGIIPLLPGFFQKMGRWVGTKTNFVKKISVEAKPEKTEVFPGAVTHKMIKKKKVILVSKRSLKNMYGKKPMILDREKQCKQIMGKIESLKAKGKAKQLNCLYLTGTSGAGKSILLKDFLKKRLTNKQLKCLYFNDYSIACDLIYRKIYSRKPDVVILDQFEKSIEYSNIYKYIEKLIYKLNKKVVFVFSFPQDFFDQIHLKISNKILKSETKQTKTSEIDTYFLGYDKHDIKQLKILVNTFLKTGMEAVDDCLDYCEKTFNSNGNFSSILSLGKYSSPLVFLCSILTRIKLGKSPLVEFSIVSYIYELYKETIDYNIDEYINNIDNVFKLYLDNWNSKFLNNETGKIILQLISDGRKYSVDDLKCVTFEGADNFTVNCNNKKEKGKSFNILVALKQNKFIQYEENFSGFKFGISAVHDYVALKMNEYCFENLGNELRQNVDHYKKRMVQATYGNSIQAESKEKITLLKRYERFYSKQNQFVINALLYFLMFASIIISSVRGSVTIDAKENWYYILIALGCFFSTYYMYNVVMWFFRILDKRYYYPLSFGGGALIVCCYIFPDLWGIFSGIEIVILV